jgi:uncharacterized lipoprotein YddW (UPF0748 family)
LLNLKSKFVHFILAQILKLIFALSNFIPFKGQSNFMNRILVIVSVMLCFWGCLSAQSPSTLKYEFRGAWISTVINLDWPTRGASTTVQQAELLKLLDDLKRSGMNVVFFQVRSESDAMYSSKLEPWSYYLSGIQGRTPSPFWDPLAFVIQEAHKRGMELHAWFNPFRAIRSVNSTYPKDSLHVSVKHPEWMLPIKNFLLLDPGIPDARQYITQVCIDLATRYDLDGIHYDDYFYPYEGIANEDAATFARYGAGMSLNAWREDNINRFVKDLGQAISQKKPQLKYGISPFGIWRNGVPAGISGLSGADVTYGNAVVWLENKWIDYLAPQLYWRFGGPQDFAKLALWWKSQMNGRHLYPGIASYRAEPTMISASGLFSPAEIPNQIDFTRQNGIPGVIHFRAANFSKVSTQGLSDSLRNRLYRRPALPPVMEWKNAEVVEAPQNFKRRIVRQGTELSWNSEDSCARYFAIYRVQSASQPVWAEAMLDGKNLLAVSGEKIFIDSTARAIGNPYWYAVTGVGYNSTESLPATIRETTAVAEPTVSMHPSRDFGITNAYPNPFKDELHVHYVLGSKGRVNLRILNALGQEIGRIYWHDRQPAGKYEASWQPPSRIEAGVYYVMLEVNRERVARKVIKAD